MRSFTDIYNEVFSHKFPQRDFGTEGISKVRIPDDIDYDRMETYAHSKDALYTFVYKDGVKGMYGVWFGSFADPIKAIHTLEYYTTEKQSEFIYINIHPSSPTSNHEFSGVEPLDPNDVYLNYSGPTNIPKEFNMSSFNDVPTGIRTDDDWDLN